MYVIAGHAASAVVARGPKQPSPYFVAPYRDHTSFDSYDTFKKDVASQVWAVQKQLSARYLSLRQTDPSSAQRLI